MAKRKRWNVMHSNGGIGASSFGKQVLVILSLKYDIFPFISMHKLHCCMNTDLCAYMPREVTSIDA